MYDPEDADILLPTDPVEDFGPGKRTTAWEWIKIFLMAAGLLASTYVAWLIPIGWIRWPVVMVAGFFAAAAVFVLGLMVASALGVIAPDTRD
jgi:fatty acid desaturase